MARRMWRYLLGTGAIALAIPLFAQVRPPVQAPAPGREGVLADNPNQVRGDELTPGVRTAVEKGLARLASKQQPDGYFGAGDVQYNAKSAVVALAGLAFMEHGDLPGRGKYGANVQKCVDAVLAAAQESGLLVSEQAHAVMYSHGFATLFLAEVYGMTGDENVKDKLHRAIRLIEKSQNPQGGWRYQPVPADADISVTICQVMALRAARDAGIKVEKETIDKAIQYVRGCQNPDGGFSYMLGQGGGGGGGRSEFPRSAAGVAALYYAGVFEGDEIVRGLDYLKRIRQGEGGLRRGGRGAGGFVGGGGGGFNSTHYFYGQYYAIQAMFLAGGASWGEWYPSIREELLAKQLSHGGWELEVSEEYCTALALIILQVPNRYLPVFSGKGPGS